MREFVALALPRPIAIICGVWFVATLALTLWIWGLRPVVFPATDEAVNRMASLLVRKTGSPLLTLPFPDLEDRAHVRAWLTIGESADRAAPLYPPVTYYFYGALACLRNVGYLLIAALPAFGVAAFSGGVGHLLPEKRRWLAAVAPILGFPALYWMLRPWMNISLMLVCLSVALFCWALWLKTDVTGWLTAATFSVGAAAAVRPDFAAHLFAALLLFSVAAAPKRFKTALGLVLAAGVCAVGVNLIFNQILTGHPLRAMYQMAVETETTGEPAASGPLRILSALLFPIDLEPQVLWKSLLKYWTWMGPIAGLLVAQLTLIPLLWRLRWGQRLAYLGAILVLIASLISHIGTDMFGSESELGFVHHSIPRYWTLGYLFAALPPLLFLGHVQIKPIFVAGTVLVGGFSLAGLYEIGLAQPASLHYVASFVRSAKEELDELRPAIPANAIVYSRRNDRILWSRYHCGLLGEPAATSRSMKRAIAAGVPVFIFEKNVRHTLRRLQRSLARDDIRIVAVAGNPRLWRVEALRERGQLASSEHRQERRQLR